MTYKLAGWVRETKGGKKYLSLAVSEAQPNGSRPRPAAEDEVPF